MQFIRATLTAALVLLFGTAISAYAQRGRDSEQHGKPDKQQGRQQKPSQEQRRGQNAQRPRQQQVQRNQQQVHRPQVQQTRERRQEQIHRPQVQQSHEQQRRQERRVEEAHRPPQPHRTRQEAATWQQRRGWEHGDAWKGHSSWHQSRAQHWEHEHRTWVQRGGYGGHHIPQAAFRLHFGRDHFFRLHRRPVMYMGYPRFWYGGYSFLLVDPWPESWGDNWYDSDNLYIVYDDGYYLYDRRHPGIALAITVVM